MSTAADAKEAFTAGRAAFKAGSPVTANPYRPARVHVLTPVDVRTRMLASCWLRGWQKERGD